MINYDIIDNRHLKLADVITTQLAKSQSAHFAVGYFYLSGFALIAPQVEHVTKLRLIIGREVDLATYEELARSQEKASMTAGIADDLSEMPETAQNVQSVTSLARMIQQGQVEVRVYTREKLHSKAYIFDFAQPDQEYSTGAAIVGSSNLTQAGFQANTELNSFHKQDTAVAFLRQWFDEIWAEAEPFDAELLTIIRQSQFGKYYTPFEIFVKALYEFLKEDLDNANQSDFPNSEVMLAEFQEHGYQKAKRMLERYDGVLICDFVGGGKTWIGKKLAEYYTTQERKWVLVVCPAALKPMWEKELEFCGRVRIVSQEFLGRQAVQPQEYRDFELILMDEAHAFRSPGSHRYNNLLTIAAGDKYSRPKKFIMLTATPINNSIYDIKALAELFTGGDNQYFKAAGIGDLNKYFRTADTKLQQYSAELTPSLNQGGVGGRSNDLQGLRANAENVLAEFFEEIVIRRSRKYIKERYQNATINGKRIEFPERRPMPVEYNLEATYGKVYQKVNSKLDDLTLACYNIEHFKRGAADKKVAQYQALVVGLIKTMLLKRFESSIVAFRNSIDRLWQFEKTFLGSLEEGRVLSKTEFYQALQTQQNAEGDLTLAEVIAEFDLPEVTETDYDLKTLRGQVRTDKSILDEILELIGAINPAQDDKLRQLQRVIDTLPQNPGDPGSKVLIFTEFKDTARYLKQHLTFGVKTVVQIDSATPHKERICNRFAPRSNHAELNGHPEIDVLISTDVLAEGQNLQDCGVLVNYDLTWNPVRLIQRVGRIDRIGSAHATITVYNFFPEQGLEQFLKLRKRIEQKLQTINQTVGLEAPLLKSDDFFNPQTFNAKLDGDMSFREKMVVRLQAIAEQHPDLFEQMKAAPYGIKGGKLLAGQHGIFLHYIANDRHYWLFHDLHGDTFTMDIFDIYEMIAAEPETPQINVNVDWVKSKARAVAAITFEEHQHIFETLLKAEKLTPPQTQIVKLLQVAMLTKECQPQQAQILRLEKIFRQPLNTSQITALKTLWKTQQGQPISTMIQALQAFVDQTVRRPTESPQTPVSLAVKPKLVCYEYLGDGGKRKE